MKPLVILQTDFSTTWSAVAEMKGVIKIVDREIEIMDLCHDVEIYNPFEAALCLRSVEPYYPKGSIFVSVIDPGVGTGRKAVVALLNDGNYVISPDNGTLTYMKENPGIKEIREIDKQYRFKGPRKVEVFHGRDIFGYVAALMASGKLSFEKVGKKYDVNDVVVCDEYHINPILKNKYVEGILFTGLKHFGSVSLNVTNDEFVACGFNFGDEIHLEIYHEDQLVLDTMTVYERSFGYVPKGAIIVYPSSSGNICIDCNQGKFMDQYQIGYGKDWKVKIYE